MQKLDRAMITVYRGGKSYTGEESADITIHGSIAGIQRLLSTLYHVGFAAAEPGEFTKRAFLNGKLDLTQAEAVHEVIQAQNSSSHIEALEKLAGSVFSYIDTIKQDVLQLVAACRVSLDYPEDEIQERIEFKTEDIQNAINKIDAMLAAYQIHKTRQSTLRIVICGQTNVGKSSLFNALTREERAIVSSTHGTTRDFLESSFSLRDIPITLYDTAGIRSLTPQDKDRSIEEAGIERSKELIAHAQLILFMVDMHRGWTEKDTVLFQDMLALHGKEDTPPAVLIVYNKCDLLASPPSEAVYTTIPHALSAYKNPSSTVCISAKQYRNIDVLLSNIYTVLCKDMPSSYEGLPQLSSERQKTLLEESKSALVEVARALEHSLPLDMISLDLDQALSSLGKITGEVLDDDVLDLVFSSFCVGK
ncbi:tRNA modification GTPase MnmE-like [Ylistrum balloti]|uniref:tRNA modification GTPase MnmE-like n=1 Tax=Ylistrum balloti TaxID=509963 RepID=UPI00290592CB|nr:tRNA modification GTPase MnmE-like [Ylistrum balloti]